MYKELNEQQQGQIVTPKTEENIKFCTDIWSMRKEHNQHTERIKDCRQQFENVTSMEKVEITQDMVKIQCRKMSDWKTPGKDGAQGHSPKNLTSLHPHIAVHLNHILDAKIILTN